MHQLLTLVQRGAREVERIEGVFADMGIHHDDTAAGVMDLSREQRGMLFANHTATNGLYTLDWGYRVWGNLPTLMGCAVTCAVRLSFDDDTGGLRYLYEAQYDAATDSWVILPQRLSALFGKDFTELPSACQSATPEEFHRFLVRLAERYLFNRDGGTISFEA